MTIRVVLADDHQLVRQSLKALLEREGFQVAGEASDGQEALRLVPDVRPDVAILDISMPILNGLDAARELKKSSPRTKTSPADPTRRGSVRDRGTSGRREGICVEEAGGH